MDAQTTASSDSTPIRLTGDRMRLPQPPPNTQGSFSLTRELTPHADAPAPGDPGDDSLVSPRLASKLTGLPVPMILSLVLSGAIRSERINREMFVQLRDVEREATPPWLDVLRN
jgi:hypothetical protein